MHSQQKLLFLEPEHSIVGGRLGKGKAESEKDLEREIETGPGRVRKRQKREKKAEAGVVGMNTGAH